MSRFSVEKFFSHSAEIICRATLLCSVSEICPVAKKLMDKGRGVSRFPVENFFSHSAECFVGPPFCAMFNKLSGGEKVYG